MISELSRTNRRPYRAKTSFLNADAGEGPDVSRQESASKVQAVARARRHARQAALDTSVPYREDRLVTGAHDQSAGHFEQNEYDRQLEHDAR